MTALIVIFDFFLDLGNAMGDGNDFWNGDINVAMDDRLEPLEMDMHAGTEAPQFGENGIMQKRNILASFFNFKN
ncbi:MAG: hypothetical protein JRE72_06105 [Deltaproteobacteria bacterium]|nr:hypothetical protein [Deltaproteobacteria bacterium]